MDPGTESLVTFDFHPCCGFRWPECGPGVWKERCSEGFTGEASARITEQGLPSSPHYPNTKQALGEGDSKDLGSRGEAGTISLGGTCSGSLQSPLWCVHCALTAACALPSSSSHERRPRMAVNPSIRSNCEIWKHKGRAERKWGSFGQGGRRASEEGMFGLRPERRRGSLWGVREGLSGQKERREQRP